MYPIPIKDDFYTTFLSSYQNKAIELIENVLDNEGIFHLKLVLSICRSPVALITLDLPQKAIPILNKYDFNVFSLKEILVRHEFYLQASSFQVVSLEDALKALYPCNLGNNALCKSSLIKFENTTYSLKEYFLTDLNEMTFLLD